MRVESCRARSRQRWLISFSLGEQKFDVTKNAHICGAALSYADVGDGAPLLCLHGGMGHADRKRRRQRKSRHSIFRDHAGVGGRQGACLAATGNWTACSRRVAGSLTYGALKLLPFWDPLRG